MQYTADLGIQVSILLVWEGNICMFIPMFIREVLGAQDRGATQDSLNFTSLP